MVKASFWLNFFLKEHYGADNFGSIVKLAYIDEIFLISAICTKCQTPFLSDDQNGDGYLYNKQV